jgi:hypothetical protein
MSQTRMTITSTELLIQLLNFIDNDESIDLQRNDGHSLIKAVEYLADDCLIGGDCRKPLYEPAQQLKLAGYELEPGEVDRFGWLSGWIIMKRGKILFG